MTERVREGAGSTRVASLAVYRCWVVTSIEELSSLVQHHRTSQEKKRESTHQQARHSSRSTGQTRSTPPLHGPSRPHTPACNWGSQLGGSYLALTAVFKIPLFCDGRKLFKKICSTPQKHPAANVAISVCTEATGFRHQ